jgi:hypothetical protein
MANEAPENTPDAAANNTDEAQAPANPETQTGKPEAATDAKFSQADLDRLIAKAKRDEKARLEKQVSDAQLSETERLKAELEARKAEVRSLKTEGALNAAIKAAGGDDPEVIQAWIQSKLTVEFDDDDKISNLKELLSEARERIPSRFPRRPGSANGGDGKPSGIGADMNSLIRRAAGRLP